MTSLGSSVQAFGHALFDSPFSGLWPIVVLPALAAVASDRTARLLSGGPRAAIFAAVLAVAPGLVALGVIGQAMDLGPVLTWRGLVSRRLTPFVATALAAWPIARAMARQVEVARLFGVSNAPGERLQRAAARLGVAARELPTDEKECLVAGLLRPTVFVSRGALAQLGDAELNAALSHERAHIGGRDTLWLMLLSLFRDLAPFGRGEALEAFRAAREARADGEAAAAAGSLNVAAALVALARPGSAPTAALPLARQDTLRRRMQALLDGAPPAGAGSNWVELALGTAFNLLLVGWPVIQSQLTAVFCDGL